MTGPIYAVIPPASTVSSQFYFERADKPWVIFVPSHAALSVIPQWALNSGGVFAALASPDASAQFFTSVWSGAGPGWGVVWHPVTPYFRISVSTQTTATMSFCVQARAQAS